jgi:hypothetical protein
VLLPLTSRGHTAFTLACHYGLTPYMPRICFTVYIPIGCVNAAILVPYQEQGEIQAQWRTIKIYLIGMRVDPKRISRSVLVQSSQVNQAGSSLLERKLVMEAIETIQCWIVYSKSSPKPSNNASPYNRLSTSQTSNYCSTPLRHLSPGQYVTNECGLNHNQQNNYSY